MLGKYGKISDSDIVENTYIWIDGTSANHGFIPYKFFKNTLIAKYEQLLIQQILNYCSYNGYIKWLLKL